MATLKEKQQELSNKFGITTFTKSGDISTVPQSGKFSAEGLRQLKVGGGKFRGTTQILPNVRVKLSKLQQTKLQQKGIKTKKPQSVFSKQTKTIVNPNKGKSFKQIQQELSNQFGIFTFTKSGEVSTLPSDLRVSKEGLRQLTVGGGKFRSGESIQKTVFARLPSEPQSFERIGSSGGGSGDSGNIFNFFTELLTPEPSPSEIGLIEKTSADLPDAEGNIFGGASGDLQQEQGDSEDEGFLSKLAKDPVQFGLLALGSMAVIIGLVKKK